MRSSKLVFASVATKLLLRILNLKTSKADFKDVEQCICKPNVKYYKDRMEKFLNYCLDELGFIRFENICWIIASLPHPEASKLQPQSWEKPELVENVEQSKQTDNDEPPQETESKEQPQKGKGSFKKMLKKLIFYCCCCGKKD